MKKKILLLLVVVCLMGLVLGCFLSTINRQSKFLETAQAINVLNNDLLKTMGEKPTIKSVAQAQMLLEQRSPSIKQKLRELLDAGQLEKNSEERIALEEVISQKIDQFVDYYEKFAEVGRDNLENLDDLKSQYNSAEFEGKPTKNLRAEILQKTEQIKANYYVIKAMESLMAGLKSIYTEIKKEDTENA